MTGALVAGLLAVLLPASAAPASATAPNCYTDLWDAVGSTTPFATTISQQTCVKATPTGYKAEVKVFISAGQESTDRVTAVYRVELRSCADNRLLSANPRTTDTFGRAGGNWFFYASTGSHDQDVYAVSYIQNAYIHYDDLSGVRVAVSGPYSEAAGGYYTHRGVAGTCTEF